MMHPNCSGKKHDPTQNKEGNYKVSPEGNKITEILDFWKVHLLRDMIREQLNQAKVCQKKGERNSLNFIS